MLERRKCPKKTVDLPVKVRFSHGHEQGARMADLSMAGMMFLCEDEPEINSEVELFFTLPSFHISPNLKIVANVIHVFEAHATPSSSSDYRYMVGVNFKNLQNKDQMTLDEFMRIDIASNRFE